MLIKIRGRYSKYISFPISILLLVLTVGCEFSNSETVEHSESLDFSGEEIFRGLFFARGDVANLFPEIWEIRNVKSLVEESGNSNSYENVQNLMIDLIKAEQPDFFDNFGNVMKSGNRVLINQELKAASNTILNTASLISGRNLNFLLKEGEAQQILEKVSKKTDIKQILDGNSDLSVSELNQLALLKEFQQKNSEEVIVQDEAIVTVVVVVAIALAVAAAAVAVAYLVYVAQAQEQQQKSTLSLTRLQQEELVNLIAIRLSPSL